MINYDLALFLAFLCCLVIFLIDRFIFAPKRAAAGIEKRPVLAEYGHSLWSVFFIVFILRAFIIGNFHVPSGSLLPTIQLGDFLFVNKLAYGVHIPFTSHYFVRYSSPKRGQIIVFHYPPNPRVDYIKTVIGLPGDHISMHDKRLYINGKEVPQTFVRAYIEPNDSLSKPVKEFKETMGKYSFNIIQQPWTKPTNFTNLVVPKGEYFVMGNNRDNSSDSRFWGFVPAQNIIGKASVIWFSWNSRQMDVRWNRIGKLLP